MQITQNVEKASTFSDIRHTRPICRCFLTLTLIFPQLSFKDFIMGYVQFIMFHVQDGVC